MDSGSVDKVSSQLELLRKLLKLGHVAYKDTAATWEPSLAPAKGYPRLVRCSTDRLVNGYYRTNEDVIKDIGALAKHIPAWREGKPVKRLKQRILELNDRYGAPYKPEDNTLERWLQLAVTVKVYDDAFKNYRADGFNEAFLQKLEERIKELGGEPRRVLIDGGKGWYTVHVGGKRIIDEEATAQAIKRNKNATPDGSGFYPVYSCPVYSRDLDEVERFELLTLERLYKAATDALQMDTEKNAEKTTAFRQKIAGGLYSTHKLTVELTATGMITQAPLVFWVNHKLSELWLYDGKAKACAQCRRLFTPKRSNNLYCSDACKDAKYRERHK